MIQRSTVVRRTLSFSFVLFSTLVSATPPAAAFGAGVMDWFRQPHSTSGHRSASQHRERDEAISLYSPAQRQASFTACASQFPGRQPLKLATVPSRMKPLALCSNHFAVLYSQTSKTPLVVVQRLNAAQLRDAKGEERTNEFFADPRLPKSARAELADYKGSNLDRGHQAPAGDAPNPSAMAQSFALSNMVPQDATHNRKIWSKVESDVRKYARRAPGDVFVFTGPLFDEGFRTVGRNRIWVPTRMFKLVYDEQSGRAWAFVSDNRSDVSVGRPMSYGSFVRTTGLELLGDVPIAGTVGGAH